MAGTYVSYYRCGSLLTFQIAPSLGGLPYSFNAHCLHNHNNW